MIRKFENLLNPSNNNISRQHQNNVTNLSSKTLDSTELNLLSKGLNFATVHTNRDVLTFIAQVDSAISDISDISYEERTNLRQKVTAAVSSNIEKSQLSKFEKLALTRLKNDDSIVVAQADKTKEAVIIDKSVYQQKVQDHLDDTNTYQKLPSNPQSQIQYRVNRALSKLKEDKKISI